MTSIQFTFILPNIIKAMANEITGEGVVNDEELTIYNRSHLAKTNWRSILVTTGGNQKEVSLVHYGDLDYPVSTALDYSRISNTDDVLFGVKLPSYLNKTGTLVHEKDLAFTGKQIFSAIRGSVLRQEESFWIKGRTRVTDVTLKIAYDPKAPYHINFDGFYKDSIEPETNEPLWVSGMAYQALLCRGIRDRATEKFNAYFMEPEEKEADLNGAIRKTKAE